MRTSIREEARSYDAKGSRRDRTIGDRQGILSVVRWVV